MPRGNFPIVGKQRSLQCASSVREDSIDVGTEGAFPGNHARDQAKKPQVDATKGDLSSYFGGQIGMNQLVAAGALEKGADGTYGGANGYTYGQSKLRIHWIRNINEDL